MDTSQLLQNMRSERVRGPRRLLQSDWVCQHCPEDLTWHRRQRQELLLTIGEVAVAEFDSVHK